jgi:hypothetical protein
MNSEKSTPGAARSIRSAVETVVVTDRGIQYEVTRSRRSIACTARIAPLKERRVRACGRPAVGERVDGEPRCPLHLKNAKRWPKVAR